MMKKKMTKKMIIKLLHEIIIKRDGSLNKCRKQYIDEMTTGGDKLFHVHVTPWNIFKEVNG